MNMKGKKMKETMVFRFRYIAPEEPSEGIRDCKYGRRIVVPRLKLLYGADVSETEAPDVFTEEELLKKGIAVR